MKKVGITLGKTVHEDGIKIYEKEDRYSQYVINSGFLPVLIPYLKDKEKIQGLLSKIDVLIISGGMGLSPFTYGEDPSQYSQHFDFERDSFEFLLANTAHKMNIPTLAICRGFQLVNVLYGGSLYQNLETDLEKKDVVHKYGDLDFITYHRVNVKKSKLQEILGIEEDKDIIVNSNHHQGIKKLGRKLKPTSYSRDGLIESFETDDWDLIGLQWHPEDLDDENSRKILEYLGGLR